MHIDLLPTADSAVKAALKGKTAVVFDVLRACSTIVTALANGCREVIPVVSVEEAKVLQSPETLLGGERNALRLPGFDCGNSPPEYIPEVVSGKTTVLTTTNGTRAVNGALAARAEQIYIGCLLNAAAVGRLLWQQKSDVCLICAGTGGQFSLEDTFGAGMVIREILSLSEPAGVFNRAGSAVTLGDLAVTACYLAAANYEQPFELLQQSLHGQKLIKMGLEGDLRWCARVNSFDFVPVFEKGRITAGCAVAATCR